MKQNLVDWLQGKDTGVSSRVILSWMERDRSVFPEYLSARGNYPLDPDDLGRCIRLLDIEPTYRTRIGEMAALSPQWAALVAHWAELEALYREEVPEHRGSAPKCYARMRELIDGATNGK